MLIYIVTEVDEREESVSSGPLSAHVDEGIATSKADEFNDPRRGKIDEIGHYAQVFPISLDLEGVDLETGALSRMVLDAERRLADR